MARLGSFAEVAETWDLWDLHQAHVALDAQAEVERLHAERLKRQAGKRRDG